VLVVTAGAGRSGFHRKQRVSACLALLDAQRSWTAFGSLIVVELPRMSLVSIEL
jgi:hypothetical protein